MPRETHLLNEAYDKVRKLVSENQTKSVQKEGFRGGLPLRIQHEIDGYISGDVVPWDYSGFNGWVEEFLTGVGFPEAEDYKPEIYSYILSKNRFSPHNPGHTTAERGYDMGDEEEVYDTGEKPYAIQPGTGGMKVKRGSIL